jgi:hypothetical protein
MLKTLIPVAALLGSVLAVPSFASYEFEYEPPCFMVTAAGELVDLTGDMCGGYINAEETAVSPVSAFTDRPQLSGAALEEALDTGAFIHADAFCEARARGGTKRESDSAATSVLADYMFSEGIPTSALTTEFFFQSDELSRRLCPELQPTGRYD